jgi:acetyl esterase/lipase
MPMTAADPLAALRPLGAVLTPELVQATYGVVTPLADPLDPAVTRADYDLAYGPHPRHRLDIYRPASDSAIEAVIIFVHGGGFAGGDKGGEGKPFFANIGAWAARHGFAAAAMTYRLVPDAQWPSGAEDVAAAIAYVKRNAETLFGAAPRLVLAGQSAGAVNVADYFAGRGGPVDEPSPVPC